MNPFRLLTLICLLSWLTGLEAQGSPYIGFQLEQLAWRVDTTQTIFGNPNPAYLKISVADHHVDHYHAYTGTQGNTGLSIHTGNPIALNRGETSYTIALGAWNFSPNASGTRYLIPTEDPAPVFRLHLSGIEAPTGGELSLSALLDGVAITPSGSGLLHFGVEFSELSFHLADDAPLGRYTALFTISHDGGVYHTSDVFRLHIDAIPEPSALLWLGGGALLALLRKQRSTSAHS